MNTTADLRSTLILMNWTLDPASGRNWLDYYPGSAYVDVLGWDAYNIKAAPWTTSASQQSYQTPDTVYGRCVSVSKAAGKPFGFGEWGSTVISGDSGSGRAAWITASGRYFRAEGAAFAAYFDTPNDGSFQLADAPSQTAIANAGAVQEPAEHGYGRGVIREEPAPGLRTAGVIPFEYEQAH